MKNLVRQALKLKFFKEGKDQVINEYLDIEYLKSCEEVPFRTYNYTNGKQVIINTFDGKAYSRNGFFFAVIANDDEYLEKIWADHKEEVIQWLDDYYKQESETEAELAGEETGCEVGE